MPSSKVKLLKMTIAILKTKTEIALAEEFDRVGTRLPGGRAVSAARRDAMAQFREHGLPHRRVEDWKYTDLRVALKEPLALAVVDDTNVASKDLNAALGPLAALDAYRVVLINGHYRAELSKHDGIANVDIRPLSNALKVMPDDAAVRMLKPVGPATETVIALNTAMATDGVVISVDTKLAKPILIVHVEAGPAPRHKVMRNTIGVLADAEVTIIEAFVTLAGAVSGHVNTATEIGIGADAKATHIKIAEGADVHLSSCAATLEASSVYRAFHFTSASKLVRNQMFPLFAGANAKLDISGVMLGRKAEHCDTTLHIDHAVPGCESRELFKIVLDDTARAVFQGKVIVRPDAQKTDGKQMAQALMLSDRAEFDSKPELEIYADDVVCGHGSTCAEIDADLMFYLRARGIPKPEARALLIESFVVEAIEKVENEDIRTALAEMARSWLHG
jgi:Fe-S cluster assembly protein SufD